MTKSWNWRVWVGFVVAVIAPLAYFSLFEITRFAVWISLLLFVVAIVLLVGGLKRAYSAPASYRGKIAGPILAVLSVALIGLFGFTLSMMKKAYSVGQNAPRVGQKAPEFALNDSNSSPVKLAALLSTPFPATSGSARTPRGVLLVFYRGYW